MDNFVYNMTQIGGLGDDFIDRFHSGDILKFTHIASADLPKYTDVVAGIYHNAKIQMFSDPTLHDSAHLIGTITLFGIAAQIGVMAISDYHIFQTSTTSSVTTSSVTPNAFNDAFSTTDAPNVAATLIGNVLANDTHNVEDVVSSVVTPTITLPAEYSGLGSLVITPVSSTTDVLGNSELSAFAASLGVETSQIAQAYDITPTSVLDNGFILTGTHEIPAKLAILKDGSVYLIKNGAFDFLPAGENVTFSFNYTLQDPISTPAQTSTANATITVTGTDNNDVLVGTSDKSLSGGAGDNVLYLLDGKGGGTFYSTSQTLNNFLDLQYAGSPTAGITVNLGAPVATASGPSIGTVTLQNIQNVIGSSGDDLFIAGTGPESFDGGAGSNTIDYSYSTTGVVVNLSSSVIGKTNQTITFTSGFILSGAVSSDTALIGNGGPVDTLKNIQNVTGSSHDDVIFAGDGNTTIEGGAGSDIIEGGSGQDTFIYNMTQIGGLGDDFIDRFHSGDILKFTHIASADLPKYTDVVPGIPSTQTGSLSTLIEMYSDPTLHDPAHRIGTITLFSIPYVGGKAAISDYPIIQTSTTSSLTPHAFNDAFSTTDAPNVAATLIGNVLANDTHNVEDVVSSVVTPTITLPAEYSGLGSLDITPVSSSADGMGNSELSAFAASLGVNTSQISQAYDITPTGVLDNGFILTGTHEIPAKLAILTDGSVYLIKNAAFDFLPAGENLTLSFGYTLQDSASSTPQTATATITVTGTDNNDVLVGQSGVQDTFVYNLSGPVGVTISNFGKDVITNFNAGGVLDTIQFNDPGGAYVASFSLAANKHYAIFQTLGFNISSDPHDNAIINTPLGTIDLGSAVPYAGSSFADYITTFKQGAGNVTDFLTIAANHAPQITPGVQPSVSLSPATPTGENAKIDFTGLFYDPDPSDSIAQYNVNFGDGVLTHLQAPSVAPSTIFHTYSTSGDYTLTITAIDTHNAQTTDTLTNFVHVIV
ncbi:beta strand repeat-containing protein [Candidatus Bealeia paramacronuclearis]|uniref:beta strand repeat-containing protein n=1 Tax=Candidatus Bealeia paramacronuclearis TaxID=1921001 RepID=UPI002F263006